MKSVLPSRRRREGHNSLTKSSGAGKRPARRLSLRRSLPVPGGGGSASTNNAPCLVAFLR